jgi:hypothetical protein
MKKNQGKESSNGVRSGEPAAAPDAVLASLSVKVEFLTGKRIPTKTTTMKGYTFK